MNQNTRLIEQTIGFKFEIKNERCGNTKDSLEYSFPRSSLVNYLKYR